MPPWSRVRHLVRRFLGSLRPGGPRAVDDAWARHHLVPGEVALWRRMSGADRRHAVVVARRAATTLGARATRPVLAAALLHDVGKVDSGLGPVRRAGATVAAYLQLIKPDIIVLLLVTTLPAMILAAGGMPPAPLVMATLFGGTLGAAGANAINSYLDRDIDEVMARTRGRPLPAHRLAPAAALRFGVALVAASFAWLALAVNVLAAALTLAAAAFYVIVYTLLMKRSTPQNIVIGGAAGAVPALVGWAAVTGSVDLPAVVLFAIVFYWTPPHFWALALKYSGDYRAAGVPMLPAVRGSRETAVSILLYSVLVVAVSLVLYPVARLGTLYLSAAVVLGVVLVAYAVRVVRDRGTAAAMALFRYSITYLGLLFAAAAVDRVMGA